jgi:hypothetical protein
MKSSRENEKYKGIYMYSVELLGELILNDQSEKTIKIQKDKEVFLQSSEKT